MKKKTEKRKPLDPELYSPAQCLAAEGRLPPDHAAWKLTRKDEERYFAALAEIPLQAIPEIAPDGREKDDRTLVGGCGECHTCWRGRLICHCATCHLTFTSVGPFDEHRYHGRCRTEAELTERGLAPNAAGHWRRPMPASRNPWTKEPTDG